MGQALFRSYGCFFAEFLGDVSLVRLGLLDLITCVGLRYGFYNNKFRKFSWRIALRDQRRRTATFLVYLDSGFNPVAGFSWRASLKHRRHIRSCASYTYPRPSITCRRSHGILTVCPSSAVLTIPLGPTNPWLTIIAKETLIFRRAGFSPALWLLVPTFLLPIAPAWVTPLPSQQMRILSYRLYYPKKIQTLSFGTILSPMNLRCNISY